MSRKIVSPGFSFKVNMLILLVVVIIAIVFASNHNQIVQLSSQAIQIILLTLAFAPSSAGAIVEMLNQKNQCCQLISMKPLGLIIFAG
jgi:hypothetical protein